MVGILVQEVTFQREIKRPARSRSQRGMMTSVPPLKMVACIMLTMPVIWNIGTTASVTFSDVALPHRLLATALCISVRCGCMHPLGSPVVPLV